VSPTDAQRARLDALKSAGDRAADLLKASCPSEEPLTPPARLAAVAKRLDAMLEAVKMVRTELNGFYNSLSDEQKAQSRRSVLSEPRVDRKGRFDTVVQSGLPLS
jgi:hypothetical protein